MNMQLRRKPSIVWLKIGIIYPTTLLMQILWISFKYLLDDFGQNIFMNYYNCTCCWMYACIGYTCRLCLFSLNNNCVYTAWAFMCSEWWWCHVIFSCGDHWWMAYNRLASIYIDIIFCRMPFMQAASVYTMQLAIGCVHTLFNFF